MQHVQTIVIVYYSLSNTSTFTENNKSIDIILKFDSLRNFSSLIIYCSNATSNHCPARFNIQTAIKNSKYSLCSNLNIIYIDYIVFIIFKNIY